MATTRPILAVRSRLVKKPSDRCNSVCKSLNTGRIAWNTALGSWAVVALRFRCSALAKVSFISLVSALVKWFPPSGTLRCQTLKPLVTTRSVASVPSETSTIDSGGSSGS